MFNGKTLFLAGVDLMLVFTSDAAAPLQKEYLLVLIRGCKCWCWIDLVMLIESI